MAIIMKDLLAGIASSDDMVNLTRKLLVRLVGHTHSTVRGVSRTKKNSVDLTGCLANMM